MLGWGPLAALWHPLLPSESPVTQEGVGVARGSPGCASHGCPCLSSPAGACPSELVKCLPGSVPPRATLTCNKTGKKDSCALTCASKARFLPGTGTAASAAQAGVPFSLHGPDWRGQEQLHGQCAEQLSSGQAEGGTWSRGGLSLGAGRGMGPWCMIPATGCWVSPPTAQPCPLHPPGRASVQRPPAPVPPPAESDSSYTVSCGTPVPRQSGPQRPTNGSQQCLGKGAPGAMAPPPAPPRGR